MAHYRQQFPTALMQKETEAPCPQDPEGKKHQWEKRSDLESRKSADGSEWEEHPWQCKRCQTVVWIPKGIELK